jgi:hypothetical protein
MIDTGIGGPGTPCFCRQISLYESSSNSEKAKKTVGKSFLKKAQKSV